MAEDFGFDMWLGDLGGAGGFTTPSLEIPSFAAPTFQTPTPDIISSRAMYPGTGGDAGGFVWNPSARYDPNTSIQSPQDYATSNAGLAQRALSTVGLGGEAPTFVPGGGTGGGGTSQVPKTWMQSFFGDKSGMGIVNDVAKLGLMGAGVGAGIMGMEQGAEQNKILRQQQRQQQQMARPAAQAGEQLTSAGALAMLGGALPPQLEMQVQEYENNYRSQMRSYMAHIGQTDSSAMVSMEQKIAQDVAAYREQLAAQLLNSGYQGIATALGPSQSAGNTAAAVVSGATNQAATTNANLYKLLGSTA